jgi:ornithine cyclodeaminase
MVRSRTMLMLDAATLRGTLEYAAVIARMRDALIAYSRGECDTPMPMHLDIAPVAGEVHIKAGYRRGGRYFVLKVASSFPLNPARDLSSGSGMMLVCSAETGEPLAVLADEGHLTDVRTAAASAMLARELCRRDDTIGIIGTGIQARLQARMHAEVLDLRRVLLWGRTRERAEACRDDIQAALPRVEVRVAATPAEVARATRLLVTATASRAPLLFASDIQPGTLISAVGADSPGKQELDPEILRSAALVLADSRRQCETLGELQHAPGQWSRAVEIGSFCEAGAVPPEGTVVADSTGLGAEDLYIAEYCYERNRQ